MVGSISKNLLENDEVEVDDTLGDPYVCNTEKLQFF